MLALPEDRRFRATDSDYDYLSERTAILRRKVVNPATDERAFPRLSEEGTGQNVRGIAKDRADQKGAGPAEIQSQSDHQEQGQVGAEPGRHEARGCPLRQHREERLVLRVVGDHATAVGVLAVASRTGDEIGDVALVLRQRQPLRRRGDRRGRCQP